MLPVKIIRAWQAGRSLMLSQDQEERYTHQGIDHLRRVWFLHLIFFINAGQKVGQFRILTGFKLKIGC